MKPNFYLRAFLALLAALVVGAGAVAAGAQTLSRSEPLPDSTPIDLRADASPATAPTTAPDAAPVGAAATAQAAALQEAADKAAREQAYYKKLEDDATYFEAVQEQAYFAKLEQQATDAAAAQATADQATAEQTPAVEAAAPAGLPDDSYWDRIAACETGGNWSMSGSRFSGGVGFANSTWNTWGGREFAANAGSATREQQIAVANRVATQGYGNVAAVGYSGWGCARHTVGYP